MHIIIETAITPFILLCDKETILSKKNLEQRASTSIIDAIRTILTENNLELKKLSFIGVSKGPGSLIGTRVGITVAKILNYTLNIPIIPFLALQAYTPHSGEFTLIANAKSKGFYLLQKKAQNFSIDTKKEKNIVVDDNTFAIEPETAKHFRLPCLKMNLKLLNEYLLAEFEKGNIFSHDEVLIKYFI